MGFMLMNNPTLKSYFEGIHSATEVTDFVREQLIKQGKPAKFEAGPCYYRTADGCKCAIGHLIPNELYQKEMEGRWLSGLLEHFKDHLGIDPINISSRKVNHLGNLQYIHDGFPLCGDNFEEYLKKEMTMESLYG
jgi:hypothetical protein